jgi:hypothetical protein
MDAALETGKSTAFTPATWPKQFSASSRRQAGVSLSSGIEVNGRFPVQGKLAKKDCIVDASIISSAAHRT